MLYLSHHHHRASTLSYVTLSSITWNYYFSENENNTNKHLLKSGVDITVWKTTDCLLELQHLLLIACHILDVATSHVHTIWSILLLSLFATQSADFVQLNSIKQKTSNKNTAALKVTKQQSFLFKTIQYMLRNTTHTHSFNGPLSGTTQVSRYQKGKTNLDFTEARQWVAVASAGPYAKLHIAPDK